MRANTLILAAGFLLVRGLAAAQQELYSDLTLDKLAGPVRSAVTSSTYPGTGVHLPNGPSVVLTVMRAHCEYDRDVFRTLGENQQTGGPYGESMLISRDAQGLLYDRRTLDRQTGVMTRYERFGPRGVINDRRYRPDGKLTAEFIQSWDENGHRSSFIAKDGDGNEVSRRRTTFTADGVLTETTSWGANGMVDWSETYDPATRISQIRNYDKDGNLRLSGTAVHDRLTSFWVSKENHSFINVGPTSGLHRDTSVCHADGTCDHLIYDYSSQDKLNPRSIELRGPAGTLKAGAYYDYVLDTHENWTSRTVQVKVNDKPLTLFEEDTRTLLYWPEP